MLPVLIQGLIGNGLSLLANAAMAKGKEWVEKETGVDLSKASLSEADLMKLRQYEMDHEEELLKLRVEDNRISAELEKAYLADTANARAMQIEAMKSDDWFVRRFTYIYAGVMSLVVTIYIFVVTFATIPEKNVRFVDVVLGFMLGTTLSTVINFLFGTSQGSKAKDNRLERMFEAVVDKVKK